MEVLGTISGALTLLANIVMAWNTHRIQAMTDASPGDHPDEVMRRLAPIGHKAHQHAWHSDFRSGPPQIEPTSPGAIRRLGARAGVKKLAFSYINGL